MARPAETGREAAALNLLSETLEHPGRRGYLLNLLRSEALLVAEGAISLWLDVTEVGASQATTIGHLQQIRRRLLEADAAITARLASTVITPLDPEDLHGLSLHLIRILESMVAAASKPRVQPEDSLPLTLGGLYENLFRCSETLSEAFAALPKGKRLVPLIRQISVFQHEAKLILRDLGARLPAKDAELVEILRQKQLCDAARALFRRYREAILFLERVVLKNS